MYESWWGREYALDLSSWDGRHLDGVFLVGGGTGDQAVVGSADAYRPRRRAGTAVSIVAAQLCIEEVHINQRQSSSIIFRVSKSCVLTLA